MKSSWLYNLQQPEQREPSHAKHVHHLPFILPCFLLPFLMMKFVYSHGFEASLGHDHNSLLFIYLQGWLHCWTRWFSLLFHWLPYTVLVRKKSKKGITCACLCARDTCWVCGVSLCCKPKAVDVQAPSWDPNSCPKRPRKARAARQLGDSSGTRHPAAAGSSSGNADPEGLGVLITKGVFKTGFYHERICFTTRYSRGFHLLQGISQIRITVTEIRT